MFETAYAMSPGAQSQGSGGIFAFLPLILIVVIIYLFMFLPQQKRQKEHRKMLGQLQKGDKVVTTGGMFGTIVGINEKDNIVVLKIDENVKVEFLRSSIAGKVQRGS